MADQLNTEEFQRVVNEVKEGMERGIPPTKEQLALLMKNNEQTAKLNEQNAKMNAHLAKANQNLKEFGKSAIDGKNGMAQVASATAAVGDAFGFISAAIPQLKAFGKVLQVVGFAFGGAAKAIKLVGDQAETLFKTYQDLSKTGQATAGGMTDVFNNMQKFAYGIKEIDQMTALLKENSTALAAFGGTAASGTQAFANASEQIQRGNLGLTFRMLGKSTDEINRGSAMYIKNQQQAGVQSSTINRDLADQAGRYIMQLDLMTKLTGETAESLQSKREEALSEEAYNQTIYELRKKGDEKSKNLANEYEKTVDLLPAGSVLLREFMQSVGGDLSAFKKTLMTAPGAVAMVGKESYTAAKFLNQAGKESSRARDSLGILSKFNAGKEILLPAKERAFLESRAGDQTMETAEKAAKAQQDLQMKGLNPATANMVKSSIASMNTRDAFESLVNMGVDPATEALEYFTSAINNLLSYIPGASKVTGGKDKIGGGGELPALKQDQAQNIELIKSALAKQGITDNKYIAATLGNVMKETQGRSVAENLDYRKTDNKRIREIFGSRVAGKSTSEINQMKSSPESMGESMYGATTEIGQRMGNMEPGDGWKYRGRGFIQLTGKSNYAGASRAIYGDDRLVKDPDLVLQPHVAAEVTAWYMKKSQGSMAKGMGIDINNMSQDQANLLATSQVAGQDVRKAGGYLGGENLDKVNRYATQQLKTTKPTSEQKTVPAPVTTPKTEQVPEAKPSVAETKAPVVETKTVAPVQKSETKPAASTININGREMTLPLAVQMEAKAIDDKILAEYATSTRSEQRKLEKLTGTTREQYLEKMKQLSAPSDQGLHPARQRNLGTVLETGQPAKISGADGFRGTLTGPSSGYKPDLTMHGTEQLTIKPASDTKTSTDSVGTNQIMAQQLSKMDQLVQAFNNTNAQDMMAMQLTKLDELVRVMQNQVNVSTKILQQSR